MTRRLISSGSTFEKEIGYTRAVVDGDWIFVSGATGFDYESMTILEDIVVQTLHRRVQLLGRRRLCIGPC